MLIKINELLGRGVNKIKSQEGSVIFLVASLALWIFIVGFITDYCRVLILRRFFTIQFDHALKAASKQLDEEQLADRVVYILEDEAKDKFSEVLKDGLGLAGSFPVYTGVVDRGYSGNLEVVDFEVYNDVPATDSLKSDVVFDSPTVHGTMRIPIETVLWKYFGVNEIVIGIHCDASTEIIDS